MSSRRYPRLKTEIKAMRSGGVKVIANEEDPTLDRIQVLLTFADTSPLAKDLRKVTLEDHIIENGILVEFQFPVEYPMKPPSARIVRPRIKYNTGGISCGGTLDLPEIYRKKWMPVKTVKDIVNDMREELSNGGARIDTEATQRHYTNEEASASLARNLNSKANKKYKTCCNFEKPFTVYSSVYFEHATLKVGSKVLLPPSACDTLSSSDTPTPWTFELETSRGIGTYCGVLEFVAPEGQVIVPPWMMHSLSLEEGEKVKMRSVGLNEATGAIFQPHSANFLELVDNDRGKLISLLQWVLQDYSTLCMGDTIEVQQRGKTYLLNVLETQPDRAVSLVSSPGLEINIDFATPLDLKDPDADVDPLALPGHKHSKERKMAKHGSDSEDDDEDEDDDEEESDEDEEKQELMGGKGRKLGGDDDVPLSASQSSKCSNCNRIFPRSGIDMHVAMCKRHNVLCTKCDGVIKKTEMDVHLATVHVMTTCKCGASIDKFHLPAHKSDECPERNVTCLTCGLDLLAKDLVEHKGHCESKTSLCGYCDKWIMVKDFSQHLRTCTLNPANEEQFVFTCLFCQANEGDEMLYVEEDIIFHLKSKHAASRNVVCPICTVKSKGELVVQEDFQSHIDMHEMQLIRKRRVEQKHRDRF